MPWLQSPVEPIATRAFTIHATAPNQSSNIIELSVLLSWLNFDEFEPQLCYPFY